MLHHFLAIHNFGEANLHLHADNCSGQNKNRYVMQYLAWWILSGLNKKIILSFLIVGHTKFSPDWYVFRSVQADIQANKDRVLGRHCASGGDIGSFQSCSVGWHSGGKVLVPTYDWATFFDQPFRQQALKSIKSMHHLTFTDSRRGYVIVKDSVDAPEKEIKLSQDDEWAPNAEDLPPIIPPPGLSLERRQYLFEKISEFCPEDCQDLVCPNPTENTPPTPKRQRRQ